MKLPKFQCSCNSKWGMWLAIIIGVLTALDAFGAERSQLVDGNPGAVVCRSGSTWSIAGVIAVLTAMKVFETGRAKHKTFIVSTTGKGPSVLLIPGLGCSGEVWQSLAESLHERGYRTHVVTLAGFAGVSAADSTSIDLVTKELSDYVAQLEEKPVVIGHSLGGVIGLNLAAQHPGTITRLILVDALPFLPAVMNPALSADQVRPQAETMTTMTMQQTDGQFANTTRRTLSGLIADTSKIEMALNWAVKSDRRVFASMTRDLMTTDLRQNIAAIDAPVLVLGSWAGGRAYGMTEEMALRAYQSQYQALRDVRIRMAKSAYHFIMLDEPRWLLDQVDLFLKGSL